jgi:serine/threonine protein kinase/tetratricopeptide (TPR) repeat protein
MATLTGRTLGKYRVGERIGRGGMAEVYEGVHPTLHRKVAIKVLHPHLMESEDFIARFEREARSAASLRQPNIVQVYDFDVEEDIVYMVMEFVDGGSLKDRMLDYAKGQGYLPLQEVADVTRQVDRALDYAHERGLVHRDVKPSNILLDQDGDAFLTDFGIVRIMSDTQFTSTGALIGTPHYMSPEQGRGEVLTPASDIYSMGVILYEMLIGSPPYDADTPLAIIHKHNNEPVPNPRDLRPDLPEAVEAVVVQALSKAPEERFQSSGALSVALDTALELSPETVVVEHETHLSIEPESLPPTEIMDKPLPPTLVEEEPPDEAEPGTTLMAESETRESLEGGPPSTIRKWIPFVVGGLAVVAVIAVLSLSGEFQSGGESPECADIEACLTQASGLMEVGDFQAAIDLFDQVAEMIPEDARSEYADVMCARGEALLSLDRREEAVGSFEECLAWTEGAPEAEETHIYAERTLAELLREGEGCPNPELCLAEAFELMEAGEFEAAIERFDRAAEMFPPDEPLPIAEAYCNRGHAFLGMDVVEEAIRSFEACMEIAGDAPEAQEIRVHAEEMLTALRPEAGECPHIDACVEQAFEFIEAGEFQAAVDLFNRAADLVPPDERPMHADLMCNRGHAFLGLDLLDEAVGSFEECLAWAGDSPEAEDIRREAERALAELLNQ